MTRLHSATLAVDGSTPVERILQAGWLAIRWDGGDVRI
jgi:hypothetical protein